MLAEAGLEPVGVNITSGDSEIRRGVHWSVSKTQLIARLQTMLHSGDLKIVEGTAEAEVLRKELIDFRVKFTQAGNSTFEARSGQHDDLVLAFALACYFVARPPSRVSVTTFGI